MNIKAILAKLLQGEALTDEEKAALAGYDPDKLAAAARKKAEGDLAIAQAKLAEQEAALLAAGDAGKSETEKLQRKLDLLTKSLADKEAALLKAETDRKQGIRDAQISKILSGIKLMDGVDPDLVKMGLAAQLAGVEDLEQAESIAPILSGFTAKNKALIVGDTGGGNGTGPKPGVLGATGPKDPSKMTAEERKKDLKERKII